MGAWWVVLIACGGWRKSVRTGDAWMEKDNPSAAARSYARAEDARPDDAEIQLKLAQALLDAGRPQDAVPHAEAAYDGDELGARLVLANAYVLVWRLDEAEALLTQDGPVDAHWLGEIALARGDFGAALGHFERAGGLRDQAAQAYIGARQGDITVLRQLGDQVPDLEDHHALADIYAGWSVARAEQRATTTSERMLALDARIDDDGGLGEQWLEASQRGRAAGYTEGSLRLALRAGAARPADALTSWEVGLMWADLGEPAQAKGWLERALATPPYDAPVSSGATVIAAEIGTIDLAERDRVRAEMAMPLADACRELGLHADEARALTVVAKVNSDPAIMMRIARSHLAAGDNQLAGDWAAAAALKGAVDADVLAAHAYSKAGDLQKALGWARTAWERDTAHPRNAIVLADLYLLNGQPHFAIQVLEECLVISGDPAVRQHLKRVLAG
jgi:tetratricopeptide (TPR) repeat protein